MTPARKRAAKAAAPTHRSVTPARARELGKQRLSIYTDIASVAALERLAAIWGVSRNAAAGRALELAERAHLAGLRLNIACARPRSRARDY